MRPPLLLSLLLATTLALIASAWVIAGVLSAPRPMTIKTAPADLPLESISLMSTTGSPLAGWFVRGQPQHGAVLLLHPVRSNRQAMVSRARFLHQAGYSVLLFDFQAHGESPGERITFGYRESADAKTALAYLRRRLPAERVGVIGVSLGGAAALLGEQPLAADALVLEAVYSNLSTAIENRLALKLGIPGRFLTPLFLWQFEPRLGIQPDAESPLTQIAKIKAPVFIIAGSEDQRTTLMEAQAMFESAPEPKLFWSIAGAAHVNFHRFAATEYEHRVLAFFNNYL